MSLYKYFEPVKDKTEGKCSDASSITLSNKDKNGISREELKTISEELQNIDKNNKTASSKRAVYKDVDKIKIARYACENGNSKAVSKFKSDFPKLNESTIRPWAKKYKSELSSKKPQTSFVIGTKRDRPTMLSEEVDQKLRSIIVNFRTVGAVINIHVVPGVLAGIVRSNLETFGQFSHFEVTRCGFALTIIV